MESIYDFRVFNTLFVSVCNILLFHKTRDHQTCLCHFVLWLHDDGRGILTSFPDYKVFNQHKDPVLDFKGIKRHTLQSFSTIGKFASCLAFEDFFL